MEIRKRQENVLQGRISYIIVLRFYLFYMFWSLSSEFSYF